MSDPVLTVLCFYCNQPVNPLARETWHRAEGWERKGKNGGSDIALRKWQEPRLFAHPHCVSLEQSHINPDQESLI